MADSENPFSNAFNPDRGGLPGFIGGLAGVQTGQERTGSATGDALAQLSQLKADNGGDNQKALLSFFQTPQGHDFFTNAGPDGLKSLVDGLNATTAPAPTQNVLAPGAALASTDRYGRSTITANNPQQFPNTTLGPQDKLFSGSGQQLAENTNVKGDEPADVRSYKFFAALSGIPSSEISRLALMKIDPSQADKSTAATQAVDKLVSDFGLPPELGEKLKAGVIKVMPVLSAIGQPTGQNSIVDMSNPQAGVQIIGQKQAQAGAKPIPALPGTTPETGAAVGVLPAAAAGNPQPGDGSFIGPVPPGGTSPKDSRTQGNPAFGTVKDMALGAGPVSKILGAATTASEAIDPRLIIDQGAQAKDRQTLLDTLRSNLQAVGTIGGGMSSNNKRIEGYTKAYLDEGFFSSPHSQVQKLIRLSEVADQNITEETERANNPNVPNEVRKQAFETVAAWQRVKTSMPSYDDLITQEKAIRDGTAGAPTVTGGAKAIIDAGGKALTEVQKQATDVGTAASDAAKTAGKSQSQINIDDINDPKALINIDPSTLSKDQKNKLIYKLGKMKSSAGTR